MFCLRKITLALLTLSDKAHDESLQTVIRKRNRLRFFILLLCSLSLLQIVSSKLLAGDTGEDIETVKQTIRNFKSVHGTAISLEDFEELVYDHSTPIESRFSRELWSELKASQQPDISLKDLKRIVKSKQDSLTKLRYTYTAHRSSSDRSAFPPETESIAEFVKYNNLLLKSIKTKDVSADKLILWNTTSYDGHILRILDYPLNTTTEDPVPNVTISELDDKSIFFDADNLLVRSLLLSTQDAEGDTSPITNLSSFLDSPDVILFENHIEINGYDCLLVTDSMFRIYLSVEMDYTPVKIDTYGTDHERDRRYIPTRFLRSTRVHSGFKKFPNSIWFPETIESSVFSQTQSLEYDTKITYSDISIDFDVDSSVFHDVIPNDAVVIDGVRGMIYKWGEKMSIGSLIKEAVKVKRQTLFRNLSLILGLCFIACWGIIEWRKRRRSKKEAE